MRALQLLRSRRAREDWGLARRSRQRLKRAAERPPIGKPPCRAMAAWRGGNRRHPRPAPQQDKDLVGVRRRLKRPPPEAGCDLGGAPCKSSMARRVGDLAQLIARDQTRWAKVVKDAGIAPAE